MANYLDYTGLENYTELMADHMKYVNSHIPFGQVDSTSTSTAFTAQIPGITALEDGVSCIIKNGVVTSATNCTLNVNNLGAKPIYYNMSATRQTDLFNVNYTFLFVYDSTKVSGGAWVIYGGYNSNTDTIGYQIRCNYAVLPVSDTARYYKIYFTSADGTKWVPASVDSTSNATSARAVNQRPIDPFGKIVYTSASTNYTAGTNLAAATAWEQYYLTLGYSFNRTGAALVLQYPKPVYIKCHPQADGSAIIDADEPYVQALPSTEDGLIYIFLGVAGSATSVELMLNHPVYQYKDGAIKQWTGKIDNLDGMLTDEAEISYRPTAGAFDVLNSGQALLTSIQGRTVSWNQLVVNGDFSNGTSGWTFFACNGSVSENVITINQTSTTYNGEFYKTFPNAIIGHKYLYLVDAFKHGGEIVELATNMGQSSPQSDYLANNDVWKRISLSYKCSNLSSLRIQARLVGKTGDWYAKLKNFMVFDLTLIYGAGNEPATPEAFEADYERWFGHPLTYEAYCAGELRNLTATGIKTVGFNQLPNEANPSVQVIGGMQYQLTGLPDDSDDDLITIDGETVELDSNDKFTPSKSGTLLVQGTYPDACLHFVHSGRRDNEYEEHWESTKNLPITTMTGKLLVNGQPSGESVVVAPHGILQAGSVQNEVKKVDGKRYFYKYADRVRLDGSQTPHTARWRVQDTSTGTAWPYSIAPTKRVSSSKKLNLTSDRLTPTIYNNLYANNDLSNVISGYNDGTMYGLFTRIPIVATTDAEVITYFTNNPVTVNFELATPEVYLLDEQYQEDSVWSYKCDDWGTEQLASGTTQSAPMPCTIEYGLNAIDTLRNLPHNYVSATMPQNFTELQKQQARENIGAIDDTGIEILDTRITTLEAIIGADSSDEGSEMLVVSKDDIEGGAYEITDSDTITWVRTLLDTHQYSRIVLQTTYETGGEVVAEQCGVSMWHNSGESNICHVCFVANSISSTTSIKMTFTGTTKLKIVMD